MIAYIVLAVVGLVWLHFMLKGHCMALSMFGNLTGGGCPYCWYMVKLPRVLGFKKGDLTE